MDEQLNQYSNNVDDTPRLRTFQSDIADAVKNQKGSIVKIAVKEHEKHLRESEFVETQKKRNIFFVTAGLLLFVLASAVFGYYYITEKQKKENEFLSQVQKKNVITADHITQVTVSDITSLKNAVENAFVSLDVPVSQIEQITPIYTNQNGSSTLVTLEDIFSAYEVDPVSEFMYTLHTDVYMYGMYQTTEQNRFLLVKSKVFSNTFSSMLAYEKTLVDDMAILLDLSSVDTKKIQFKDRIINNEDVRIGYINDEEVISYTFFGPKKEFLLITKRSTTMQDLITRFTTKLFAQ